MALTDNLVAYYKLDDMTDNYGTYDLTNSGGTSVTGLIGNAYSYGTNNPINTSYVLSNLGMTYASPLSLQYWIKVLTPPTGTSPTTSDVGVSIFWATNPGNYLCLPYAYESGNYGFIGRGGFKIKNINDSNFHHVVILRDQTANTVKLYVDNALLDTGASFASNYSAYTTGLWIASFNGSDYASQVVDEVGVWNRILTTTEISSLYNAGAGYDFLGGGPPAAADTNKGFFNYF